MSLVVALPTQETKDRIQQMFLSAPVAVDVESMYVPLSQDVYITDFQPRGPYSGKFVEFRHKYGQNPKDEEMMELVGVIESAEMVQTAAFYGVPVGFEIRLIFRRPAPAFSSTNRSFLMSIAETLCMKEVDQPFTFTQDYLLTTY